MKTLRVEYVIYKQTSLNMYPMETYKEELTATWYLNQIRKRYPQCTYVLAKRVITEENLEV